MQQLGSNGPGLSVSSIDIVMFYFVSNLVIIFQSSLFDKAWALMDVFSTRTDSGIFQTAGLLMSIYSIPGYIDAFLLMPKFCYDYADAFKTIHEGLRKSSKSFYVSSFSLPISIRQDFLVLYAFCSCTDDLIDDKTDTKEVSNRVKMIKEWLDLIYNTTKNKEEDGSDKSKKIDNFLRNKVPEKAQAAFLLFCNVAQRLPRYPFDHLLQGYQWDLERFVTLTNEAEYEKTKGKILIKNTDELIQYCRHVAGSIGEMMVWVYFSHFPNINSRTSSSIQSFQDVDFQESRCKILEKANNTGVALQLINIARDIREDAEKLGRVYIPIEWFNSECNLPSIMPKIDSERFVKPSPMHLSLLLDASLSKSKVNLNNFPYATYTAHLLELANNYCNESINAIDLLPKSCQAATRIVVKVYEKIGVEVFNRDVGKISKGQLFLSNGYRVRVSTWNRIWIALKEMYKLS